MTGIPSRRMAPATLMLERLVRLGLTQYEARAYVALVRRDASTPAEVARLARVPRPRIYDVIDSLVAKGLVAERPGRTARFAATPPAEAAALLVGVHAERLAQLEADAAAIVDDLGPAFLEGRSYSDPLDYIELIRSPEAIGTRFRELQQSVRSEMLIFNKIPVAVTLEENMVGLDVAREHVLRTIYEFSVLDDAVQRAGVRRFIEAGEEARFVSELPMKLVIIDERTVMFVMSDPVADPALTTLVIENAELAQCLKIAFEQTWTRGLTFEAACERQGLTGNS